MRSAACGWQRRWRLSLGEEGGQGTAEEESALQPLPSGPRPAFRRYLSIPSCFPSCSGLSYHPLGDRVYSQCRSRGVIAPGDRDARILVPLGAWDELHGPW